jgi:hypothetical protein
VDAREIEHVLTNWISQAATPPGELPPGTDPARWVAQRFLQWWRPQVSDELGAAEVAVAGARSELERLGGWSNPELGNALHELIHVSDALAALRTAFGDSTEDLEA